MKFLVVDDLALNRKLLRAQLEGEGHEVVEAGHGVAALKALEQENVDGIISDILMPEMDGYRLCLEIRRSARWSGLPFILYTSTYNSPSDRELASTVGADAYLTKPSPVATILEALQEAGRRPRSAADAVCSPTDAVVLRQYNEALVNKLEHKNAELGLAIEHLNEMNENLERRVALRTQELEAANRELEAFSYSVAHDLRSPLSAIMGFVRLFQHSLARDLPESGRRYLDVIDTNAKRMATLIDDLLSLAQMDRHELSRQTLDLRSILDECIRGLHEEHPDRQVEVKIGALPTCMGDPVLLRQVLHNLVGNAFKYTGKKAVGRIEIGAEAREEGNVIFIRDNGAGFDMLYADRLFGAFQRLHGKKDFEGTGLGLAIVDRIIKRHGGRVWAVGEVDKGATFYFTLAPSLSKAM